MSTPTPGSRPELAPGSTRGQALFERLCAVGNALEEIRDDTYPQGPLWVRLSVVLQALDAAIDTLVETPAGGCHARRLARIDTRPELALDSIQGQACAYCGEEGCEDSCTGAILAQEASREDDDA